MKIAYIIKIVKIVVQDNKKLVLFIFLFAFVLRVIFVLSIQNKFYFSDSLIYEDCAIRILEGKGFGNYERAPLYPLWMSLVYLLAGGKNIVLLRILESAIGSLLCVIVFYLGQSIFERHVGVIAAILSSIYPLFVFLPGLNYPTLLSTFFVSLGVYLTVQVSLHNRIYLGILTWAVFGLSTLAVAPTATLSLAAAIWILFFSSLRKKYRILHGCIMPIFFLLSMAPWTIRHYVYYQKLIPIRYDASKKMLSFDKEEINNNNVSIDAKEKMMSIYHNPSAFLKHFGRNSLGFFRLYPSKTLTSANPNYNLNVYKRDKRITKENPFSVANFSRIISALTFGPILLFTIIGLIFPGGHLRKLLLLVFLIFTLAFTYAFFYGKFRYRIPIEPLMIIISSHGIKSTFDFLKVRFFNKKLNLHKYRIV